MTFTPGLVTTIIPVYNREKMLVTAVESVLAQTYRPIEIIIADDGSTDDTPLVARSLSETYPGVVYSLFQKNSGPGPARELGRQSARGEFIQYLDSDDRLMPNKFTDQIAALKQSPEADIAYGVTRLVDESGQILAEPFKWTGETKDTLLPGLLVDRWWCTHTPLYRRSLTDRIGGWSTLRWSQDWEYDSRAAALGAKLVRCPVLVSEHVHHQADRQTSANASVWRTDPVRLRNRIELLTALGKAAEQSKVPRDCLEMKHFSRWCFAIARQCLIANLPQEASEACQIAVAATRPNPDRSILWFARALRYAGPAMTRRLTQIAENFRGGRCDGTMRQSFDGQIPQPQP